MILDATRHWSCPNCTSELVTRKAVDRPVLHPCRGLHGIIAPMISAGSKAKVTAVEREDYIGDSNAGRVMSVVTERPDGSNDTAVFAPTAQVISRST